MYAPFIAAGLAVGMLTFSTPLTAAPDGLTMEMQARQTQRQGGAMTPQRARRECWQSLGFGPSTPRTHYPARLQPQVEACVAQKLRR